MTKRAFAYLRTSTSLQELSPIAQRDQIAAYCVARGYDLVAVFDESGVSGTVPFAKRERGADLLAKIAEVDAVVFSKLDRAFRDTVDCIMTVDFLRSVGKAVHFLDLGIDTTTAAGQFCLELMASLAKFERRRIADRTKEALGKVQEQGRKIGRAPFGTRNLVKFAPDGKRVGAGLHGTDEAEIPIVRRIFELSEQKRPHLSHRAIARKLNEECLKTRTGKPWIHQMVGKVIARRSTFLPLLNVGSGNPNI